MQVIAVASAIGAFLAVLAPFIYLKAFHRSIPKMVAKFPLTHNVHYDRKFPQILRAFLSGSNWALKPVLPMSGLRAKLDNRFEPFYKGFAYEGAGMGLGVKSALFPSRGRRFEAYIHQLSPGYLYQYYVGLGWYLMIRHGFRYGGYKRWIKQLHPRYAPIVFDGAGFKTALFHYKKNKQIIQKFRHFPFSYQRVCYQGFGRCLWFLTEFDLQKTAAELENLPAEFRHDAYSGVGLAAAYSFFDQLAFAAHADKQIPEQYRPAFRQGLAFGWEARRLQDPVYWDEQLERYTYPVILKVTGFVDRVHEAVQLLGEDDTEADYYLRWMDTVRSLLKEK
ncbi:DUF1702 family protein [Paenibacillus chitinolyticus]|uniref:DUF1702 family protein n=1 Tax=Paenibacillus chitinolyticus TaxID=79263 RepID=UPI003644D462